MVGKKVLTRAKRNKRDRERLKRITDGRRLAFQILDTQTKLSEATTHRSLPKHSDSQKNIADLQKAITDAKSELMEMGFDVEETLSAAQLYRDQLAEASGEARPVRGDKAGMYRLGTKLKVWR